MKDQQTQETPERAGIPCRDLLAVLESRHETLLEWSEPWPACGPEGNELDAHVTHRATIHDCINMQRRWAATTGRPTKGADASHLLDFMAEHWAHIVPANSAIAGAKSPDANGQCI